VPASHAKEEVTRTVVMDCSDKVRSMLESIESVKLQAAAASAKRAAAAVLFHDVVFISRVLDTLQLQHHLAAFIKEGVTDDIVCALSADNLRSLGLGLGDAVRFMTAVQKELAVPQDKSSLSTTVAAAGGAEFGGIAPDRRLEPLREDEAKILKTVKSWYAEIFGQPVGVIYSKKKTNFDFLFGRQAHASSAIYLSELRSFGPSAAFIVREADQQVSGG